MKRTRGSEPSQYPEEKKANAIPKVAASEIGSAQTRISARIFGGCRACNSRVTKQPVSRTALESAAIECDSHVDENGVDSKQVPEYRGARETLWESAKTISQG
jgi:hypothetical protein